MRRFVQILLLSMLVSPTALAQGWSVNPGDGVGAISLGMTSSQVSAVLTPTRHFGPKRNPALVEYGSGLMVEYEGNKAVIISLHKNSFKTKSGPVSWTPYKGASIGAAWNSVASQLPMRRLERKMPTAKGHPKETYYAYTDLGLGFRVRGGSIVKVDVWAK